MSKNLSKLDIAVIATAEVGELELGEPQKGSKCFDWLTQPFHSVKHWLDDRA